LGDRPVLMLFAGMVIGGLAMFVVCAILSIAREREE
jgi:hypothetical protein